MDMEAWWRTDGLHRLQGANAAAAACPGVAGSMKEELLRADHALTVKSVINWLAAALGIGSFLGLVNLVVGVLSAAWLGVQLYGYLVHELPMKRMRKKILQRELDRVRTQSADLGRAESDE